jgi:hypothetical protein
MPVDRSGIIRTAFGFVGESFKMRATWTSAKLRGEASYCAAECGEYRQFVRGHMLAGSDPDGKDAHDVAPIGAGGAKLQEGNFTEDALDDDPTKLYGHRTDPQKGADKYSPDPRTSGPQYEGSDRPGINTGRWADLYLEFLGQTIDVCNGGKETSAHRWTVQYKGIIRPSQGTGRQPPATRGADCAAGTCGCASCATGSSAASSRDQHSAASVANRLGPGRDLGAVRRRMEAALGTDLSSVRLHTDPRAAALARELSTPAFAIGNDVGFAAGEFQPGTPEGDAMLAHELAHTVQQGNGTSTQREAQDATGGPATAAEERDADRSALGAVARLWGSLRDGATATARRVMPELRSGLQLRRCTKPEGRKCCSSPTTLSPASLTPLEPDRPCDPQKVDPNEVFGTAIKAQRRLDPKGGKGEDPFAHPDIYGLTIAGANTASFDQAKAASDATATQTPNCADQCTPAFKASPPRVDLDLFIASQAGPYKVLGQRLGTGKCKGKALEIFEVVPDSLAAKIFLAEREHCEDIKEAWRRTYGIYLAGAQKLAADGLCPDPGGVTNVDAGPAAICKDEYKKALAKLTGFATPTSVQAAFECLHGQSKDRDNKKFHTIRLKFKKERVLPDCKGIEKDIVEEGQLPEVTKHPPSEFMAPECGGFTPKK